MGKNKKRGRGSASSDHDIPSSPLTERGKRHKSIRATSGAAHDYSTLSKNRRDNSLQNDRRNEHRSHSTSDYQPLSSQKHSLVLPTVKVEVPANLSYADTPQDRQGSWAENHKKKSQPAPIPPADPRKTSILFDDAKSSNRPKIRQHPLFAANISEWADSSSNSDSRASLKLNTVNSDNDKQRATDEEEEDDNGKDSETSTSSDSDSESSRTSSSDSTSSTDTDDQPLKRPKRSRSRKSSSNPAVSSKAKHEAIRQGEKDKMARATQRAIATLLPPKETQPHPQTATLTSTERKHLRTLHQILPPSLLDQTRTNLEPKPKSKHKDTAATDPSPPTDTTITLSTAHDLILRLSARRLSLAPQPTGSRPPSSTTSDPSTIQTELLRIIQQREAHIRVLENEIRRLRAGG